MDTLIVVDDTNDFRDSLNGFKVLRAVDYIVNYCDYSIKNIRVLNLCNSYEYQSSGYYVSLVADARKHFPMPSVSVVNDVILNLVSAEASDELNSLIQKSFRRLVSEKFELSVYFGKNLANCYDEISKRLFRLFPVPFFRAYFTCKAGNWVLDKIKVLNLSEMNEEHYDFSMKMIPAFIEKRYPKGNSFIRSHKYKMAILCSDKDKTPPSDNRAINNFTAAAKKKNIAVDLINENDLNKLERYDALFIRSTTCVKNFTYEFARKAEANGLVVIDDPVSILKCTNKIYLNEILKKNKVLIPESMIISRESISRINSRLGFPCVIKIPDGSFSQGVYKFSSYDEVLSASDKLFASSELLIAQAYLPTAFDWRIGVLNSKPIYACRYYMAGKHWQIYSCSKNGDIKSGRFDTVFIHEVPYKILNAAITASGLIGNGLYGVDVKEVNGEPYIIEINDNPSIESGVEDKILKKELYDIIIDEFINRLDGRR